MVELTTTAPPDMIINGKTPVWLLQDGTFTTTPQYRVQCRNCESLQERAYPPHYCLYCGIELATLLSEACDPSKHHAHALGHRRN